MDRATRRALRFARGWAGAAGTVTVRDVELSGPAGALAGTRYAPPGPGPRPGWVLLHGLTRTGRRHVSLQRLARAMAASGATVVVPEVPEWVALRLAPDRTHDAVESGVRALERDPDAAGPVGLVGFSFGGPQALRAAGQPGFRGRIGCVAAFGSYDDLGRTLDFLFTGRHELDGQRYRALPDPYGRWVVAANYLTRVPGCGDRDDVAGALWELAAFTGDHMLEAEHPRVEALRAALADRLPPGGRTLFELLAPPTRSATRPAPPPGAEEWAGKLLTAGVAADPLLALSDPLPVPVPVILVHGRGDTLIPFTETLRLARRVRTPRLTTACTGLFSHSTGDGHRGGVPGRIREVWRLGVTLRQLLGSV
ncbi:MAG: hypothetical protein RQ751_04140 [Longimicrobiales bacterium]|nr:hypothetical protein [Longimicrobiales bacterium]